MSDFDFEQFLIQSLEDQKFTRGERRVLKQFVEDAKLSTQELATLRAQAFSVARENLSRDKAVLEWLEDCIRCLVPAVESNPTYSEAHFSPGDNCVQRIVELINQCQSTMDVCVFTITDNRLSRPMIAAHERGVEIRIISDDDKATDRGSDILDLDAAGIPVRVDKTEHHMHHKFAIFDNKLLLTGSYNWTRSAALNNEENFVIVNDRHLIKQFSECFEDLWKQFGGGA